MEKTVKGTIYGGARYVGRQFGDNANSGKDAAHPMASLSALFRAYDINPGDTVFVDTGRYNLITNFTLGSVVNGLIHSAPLPLALAPRGTRESSVTSVRSITAALGITFPFNITLGIPIYLEMARRLYS